MTQLSKRDNKQHIPDFRYSNNNTTKIPNDNDSPTEILSTTK